MKALKITLIIVATLGLIGGAGYLYASSGIKSKPGFADISKTSIESENALLSVKVGPGGVKPLRWFLEQIADNSEHGEKLSERALKNALKELQGIQLRVYDSTGNRHAFDSAIAETAAALKQKQWETLMTVRDDEEQIIVLQFADEDKLAGLSIMASTPDTAFFLNLIGPFDIEGTVLTKEDQI